MCVLLLCALTSALTIPLAVALRRIPAKVVIFEGLVIIDMTISGVELESCGVAWVSASGSPSCGVLHLPAAQIEYAVDEANIRIDVTNTSSSAASQLRLWLDSSAALGTLLTHLRGVGCRQQHTTGFTPLPPDVTFSPSTAARSIVTSASVDSASASVPAASRRPHDASVVTIAPGRPNSVFFVTNIPLGFTSATGDPVLMRCAA